MSLQRRLARADPALPFQPVLWGRSMGAAIALRAASLDTAPSRAGARSADGRPRRVDRTVLRRRRLPFPRLLARLVIRRAGKLAGMRIDRPGPVELAPECALSDLDHPWTDDPSSRFRSSPPGRCVPVAARTGSKSPGRSTPTSSTKAATRCSTRSRHSWMRLPAQQRCWRSWPIDYGAVA